MPIMRPEIQKVLRAAGLDDFSKKDSREISELLDSNGLSVEDVLQSLAHEMRNGDTSAARIRAQEISLKIRGLMKETVAPPTQVSIVINDPDTKVDINPILIPRELL